VSAVCAIGLGSNLGDSRQTLDWAIEQLTVAPAIQNLRVANYYRTKPIGGPPNQPDYLNSAATFTTSLDPWQLLELLQAIEHRAGRTRSVRWAARTLDLDLLLYGAWQIESPHLQVPHPRLADRAFVLVPLAEIAGAWHCNDSGGQFASQTVQQLLSAVDCSDVALYA
jgi:2-amino-4-hydroxy-6-hydroxymethyldihydropteridine diphosphokinase